MAKASGTTGTGRSRAPRARGGAAKKVRAAAAATNGPALPPHVDLWPDHVGQPPWVQNEGKGCGGGEACTAFAVGAAAYWARLRASPKKKPGTPDFAFLYNNEAFLTAAVVRYMRQYTLGEHPNQLGTFRIRAAARVASVFGVRFLPAGESVEDLTFDFTPPPPFAAFVEAHRNRFLFSQLFPPPIVDPNAGTVSLQQPTTAPRHVVLRQALASGRPVVVGFTIPSDMVISRAGDVPPLAPTRDRDPASHAVLVVGYDDAAQRFRFRNSYGPTWGTNGYGTLPYDRVDSPDATFGFFMLLPPDATVRPRVMFRGLRVENLGSAHVSVVIDAYDGLRNFLGSATIKVGAQATVHTTPVRWLDTYRLDVVVTPRAARSGPARGVQLHVDDPDGAVASHARITIPADANAPLRGRLSGHRNRALRTVVTPGMPMLQLEPAQPGG